MTARLSDPTERTAPRRSPPSDRCSPPSAASTVPGNVGDGGRRACGVGEYPPVGSAVNPHRSKKVFLKMSTGQINGWTDRFQFQPIHLPAEEPQRVITGNNNIYEMLGIKLQLLFADFPVCQPHGCPWYSGPRPSSAFHVLYLQLSLRHLQLSNQ